MLCRLWQRPVPLLGLPGQRARRQLGPGQLRHQKRWHCFPPRDHHSQRTVRHRRPERLDTLLRLLRHLRVRQPPRHGVQRLEKRQQPPPFPQGTCRSLPRAHPVQHRRRLRALRTRDRRLRGRRLLHGRQLGQLQALLLVRIRGPAPPPPPDPWRRHRPPRSHRIRQGVRYGLAAPRRHPRQQHRRRFRWGRCHRISNCCLPKEEAGPRCLSPEGW